MSELTSNNAYADEAEARLTTTNRLPNITAIARAFAEEVQLLEDAAWEVLTETTLDTAVGRQLDVIGKLLVEPRKDRADEPYRAFLKARVRINRSFGRTEDVIDVVRLILGEDGLRVRDYGGGYYEFEKEDADPDSILAAVEGADLADPLGVEGRVIFSVSPISEVIIWGSTVGSVPRANGFDDAVSGGFPGKWGGVL